MKATRKVFLFTGEKEAVRNILDVVSGFKAIEAVDELVPKQREIIFKRNRNAICSSTYECQADYEIMCYNSNGKVITGNYAINAKQNIVMQMMHIANQLDIDIGDHRSNATVVQETHDDCLFCKLLDGHPVHRQDTIYESDSFRVVPGSGAFIQGYLMILPKKHVMSVGELQDNERTELLEVLEDVKSILKSVYNEEILVWENGSGAGGAGKDKTSIVHAHVHACPTNIDILSTTELNGISVKEIAYKHLPNYKKESYLLVNVGDKWYIRPSEDVYIPRQYVRQLIASNELTEIPEVWNWRTNPFWDDVQKCSDTIINWLKENWNTLPDRIKGRTEAYL